MTTSKAPHDVPAFRNLSAAEVPRARAGARINGGTQGYVEAGLPVERG